MRTVKCVKLNREAEGLDLPLYPGKLGEKIYKSISKEAWQMWLRKQTILINENHLSLADPKSQIWLKQELNKFLFEDG